MRGPVLVLGLVLLTGCGPGKPPPIAPAPPVKPQVQSLAFSLPTDPAPTTSDPASRAVVEAAVQAHTGGQPNKLQALRTARKVVGGTLEGPNGPVANEWQFTWRWPDRWRTEISVQGNSPVLIRRVGRSAWLHLPNQPERPIDGADLTGVLAETFAECLLVLAPLADPAAVFSPAPGQDVRGKPAVGVRVSGPDWPTTVCHFDAATKRLVQVNYAGSEGGKPTGKEVTVLADKAFDGVTVPERLRIVWDGREVGEWTLRELQFPVTADDKLFAGP